ncbi:Ett1p SCDLUD_003164 [Saccharomycodes ludwigii]|uniref:Ett1p n=1 Tax=Saccharomycodes ludwigii TaxID=36035 RepID=UPI001E8C4678|nr:hypothetical protein SCDLUD_003164 [Saccharomycodes ludwigii]KAH3900193.1 hypothetical protein SCDLUD_003164 [Saccharomycodes ludwigii]
MAKRPLGLGKSAQQKIKKQKAQATNDNTSTADEPTQIQIQLDSNADLDDELTQLNGLWNSYVDSERDDELILNGIIHECDRLLRSEQQKEKKSDTKPIVLTDIFHSIYALALSELTIFKSEEDDEKKRFKLIADFFDSALERVQLGLEKYPDSSLLRLTESKIIFQRIPLEYIAQLNTGSKNKKTIPDIKKLLKRGEQVFDIDNIEPKYFDLAFQILQSFNDCLDIIENFGHESEIEEGLDSDVDEDLEEIELDESHPLYEVKKQLDEHYQWLREKLEQLFLKIEKELEKETEEKDDREKITSLYASVAKTIGELYLKAAEIYSHIFTALAYEDDAPKDIDGFDLKTSQKKALELTSKAVNYFEKAVKKDDPQTWVDHAEAIIDLGNLYDYKSEDQESSYAKAESLLEKANKATNGKYKDVLDKLLSNDDDE